MVLGGGGAKMIKIKESAKKSFKLFCKIGKVKGFFPKIEGPEWIAASGLILLAGDILKQEETIGRGIIKKIKALLKSFIP